MSFRVSVCQFDDMRPTTEHFATYEAAAAACRVARAVGPESLVVVCVAEEVPATQPATDGSRQVI